MTGVILVLLGDFRQFRAISHSWTGSPLREDLLGKSQVLWELAEGRWLQLTTNHRSDKRLFDFYSKIDVHGDESLLSKYLEDARKESPVTDRMAETQLVISHKARMKINTQMNRKTRSFRSDCLLVTAPSGCS